MKKITEKRDVLQKQQDHHFRQQVSSRAVGSQTQTKSAIIATKRDTWQRIADPKVEEAKRKARKDKDLERAVTDQIRQLKQQTSSYLMCPTWQVQIWIDFPN